MPESPAQNPIVIIGAGPTGLGAARALHEAGREDWLLIERSAGVGGLSRSIVDKRGFTWDIGGHVGFSHFGAFTRLLDELLPPEEWLHHERESWVRVLEKWVPYPFQNNIRHLPPEACARCLEGLIRAALANPAPPFGDFAEFIDRIFGEGIAEIFMKPYNFKVWAYEPRTMSADWLAERVAVPDVVRVTRNIVLEQDDVNWGPNNRFRFPRHGGTGAIWQALADSLPAERLRLEHEVVGLDVAGRCLRLADGGEQRFSTLISTMPVDRLTAMSERRDWAELASGLVHSATHVVGVGLEGAAPDHLKTKCWMYFPEDLAPFYRVTHFSHYSPGNVDDIGRHWSLMAEVSESPTKPVDASKVVMETVAGLERHGMIEASRVTHTWVHREEYGYPTPSKGRDSIVHKLLPAMEEEGVLSRGRFGAWLYEASNMDHSYMQGCEAARHVMYNTPEFTLWRPHVVNQPHPALGWNIYR